MAWAQRDETVHRAFSIRVEQAARRCEACGRVIDPARVFVVRRFYCSSQCANQAAVGCDVPGLYLG
jgi:hypothetical protein